MADDHAAAGSRGTSPPPAGEREALDALLATAGVTPVFQPILDLLSGRRLGFEVLSRGQGDLHLPEPLFAAARRHERLWDLERTCRRAAVGAIARLDEHLRSKLFFINVSPDVFADPRFLAGFTLEAVTEHGLDPSRIVIEITERQAIRDHHQLQELVRHYVSQGFKVALDDFGAGDSGLVTLISTAPQYLKLDMELAREVERHPYKQHLVRSLVSFAAAVDARVIAEGVESWAQLEVLARLGVRYAQGYLFARPAPTPPALDPEVRHGLGELRQRFDLHAADDDEAIANMTILTETVEEGTMSCEDLHLLLRRSPSLEHIVTVHRGHPTGLVTRQHFHARTSGPVGYSLFQKRPVEAVAKREPLVVEGRLNVTTLAKLAMERGPDDLYDPVIVVDARGRFMGTITIKQLIARSVEVQVQQAQGANPLTGLPGNRSIERWIRAALDSDEYTVVYADLDRFKEYNDCYGFLMGDEVIRFTARVLAKYLARFPKGVSLGHVGGDDFVFVAQRQVAEELLADLCREFDEGKLQFFSPADGARGYFEATDRRGQRVQVKLVTLSLAAICSTQLGQRPHPAQLGQIAASLKKKVKQLTQDRGESAWLFERRRYDVWVDAVEGSGPHLPETVGGQALVARDHAGHGGELAPPVEDAPEPRAP
jgi:EAL domain-containing protein (putative c-di-GMP-specific phosphodiesterase class I)/GGDEF domain-containing protein